MKGLLFRQTLVPTLVPTANRHVLFPTSSSPDALCLQYIRVCGVERCHKAAYWDVLHPGDGQGVREEDGPLVDVHDCDVDGGGGAGAVAYVRDQRVLILHLDQQCVERRALIVQRLWGSGGQQRRKYTNALVKVRMLK